MNEQVRYWDDLRIVLAIARTGSLSGAARELDCSHPTVFRQINRIEAGWGVRLFERSRTGYAVTPAGEALVALAERMEGDIRIAERQLAGQDLRPSGRVRVTTTDTLLIGFLSRIFRDFRRAYPEIDLDVIVTNELSNISRRDADVAIRPSKQVPENLVGRKLTSIGMAVYGHVGLVPEAAEDTDLHAFEWVGPGESLSALPLARWLREEDFERCVVYRVDTLLGCMDAIRNRIGIGVLPGYLCTGDRDLVRLGPAIPALESELWLLTHPDLRKVTRIRSFLDFMAAALKPHEGQFRDLA